MWRKKHRNKYISITVTLHKSIAYIYEGLEGGEVRTQTEREGGNRSNWSGNRTTGASPKRKQQQQTSVAVYWTEAPPENSGLEEASMIADGLSGEGVWRLTRFKSA